MQLLNGYVLFIWIIMAPGKIEFLDWVSIIQPPKEPITGHHIHVYPYCNVKSYPNTINEYNIRRLSLHLYAQTAMKSNKTCFCHTIRPQVSSTQAHKEFCSCILCTCCISQRQTVMFFDTEHEILNTNVHRQCTQINIDVKHTYSHAIHDMSQPKWYRMIRY